MKSPAIACLAFTLAASIVQAEDHAVGAKIGMLGIGVEYTYRVSERLAVRGGVYGASYTFDDTQSGVDYELELDLDSFAVGVDFHPTKGALRLSVGALSNDNGIAAQSNPTQSFTIGGTTYAASDVGTLRAEIGFDSVAPFVGIGWDFARSKRVGVTLDLGLISQGSANARLSADGPILGDPQFADDLALEERELQDSLDDFDLYPFASLGFAVRF